MKRIAIQLLLCLLVTSPATADEANWCGLPHAHRADTDYARAMEKSGGVTADMRSAQGDAFEAWDAELNRLYRRVMQQFGKGMRADALREAQRAWLAWDKAEMHSDLAQQADGGSIGPVIVSGLALQRRRARACTLHDMQEPDAAPN